MTNEDLTAIGKELAAATRAYVAGAIGKLTDSLTAFGARVKALEDRPVKDGRDGIHGKDGSPGRDGKDGAPGIAGKDGAPGADGAAGAPGAQGSAGEPGQPGADGAPGPPGPAGADGVPGQQGAPGADGKDGAQGPTGPLGEAGHAGADGAPGPPGPAGADGAPGPQGNKGDPGEPGARGADGAPGPAGRDGADGKSVSIEDIRPLLEVEIARAVLDLERRATDVVHRAVDRIPPPAPGKDGIDGLGFDDIAVEHDGERGFTFRFLRGDQVKTFGSFTVPAVIYRGVFEDGRKYEKDDTVTWNGSTWIATKATSAKPGLPSEESRAWTLMVKRGSDGRQGPQGPAGAPPKPVRATP